MRLPLRITKSCEGSGHVEKTEATVHTGGVLRSVCGRCGVPLALKVGGWKAIPPQTAIPDDAVPVRERRQGRRGSVFDRAIAP